MSCAAKIPSAISSSASSARSVAVPVRRESGIVDWDDPASWNAGAALEALVALAHDGVAEVPVYSIPLSRRTGT